ncbi:hypothetical protein EIN_182960 [Entamoeba invadens IP1]|uniref:hypothetical protein n=1 Tax=Entamoeba invadens IP1 TaxID=370355 RepID=UPI0002C3F9E6|nr:hypothetical protein EIN_182960 [Entamoeba invadens IP1]ELP94039.1 hypothetical protein EIN_182960 [Entamoeba invadens IP1]|eukprot:XP_004260810.1 hypothetical protein EIN_182960 [Entamoeba invadens IP1]
MDTQFEDLIEQVIKTKSLHEIKSICHGTLPDKFRSDIYQTILAPKVLVKQIVSAEHNEVIDTMVAVNKTIVWAVVDTIIARYTISPTKTHIAAIYRVAAYLYSLNPFEIESDKIEEKDLKPQSENHNDVDKANTSLENSASSTVKDSNEKVESQEEKTDENVKEKKEEKSAEVNASKETLALDLKHNKHILSLTNTTIAFFDHFHKYLLSRYPSCITGINNIFSLLLLFHCPSLSLKVQSKRISLDFIMNEYFLDLLCTLPDTPQTLFSLWDFLFLNEDPSTFFFVLLAIVYLRQHDFGDSMESFSPILATKITLTEVPKIIGTANYLRTKTPLTVFRYITGCVTYSYNFQKYYARTLKNSICVVVNAVDVAKDITTRHITPLFIDCRNQEDFDRCSVTGAVRVELPITGEHLEELEKEFSNKNRVVFVFGSNAAGHFGNTEEVKSAVITLCKKGVSKICVVEGGFEELHAAAMKKMITLDRHKIPNCYVCNPQVKNMEKIMSTVEEKTKKAKETVTETSANWWNYISQKVDEGIKKYEETSAKNMEEALKEKNEREQRNAEIEKKRMADGEKKNIAVKTEPKSPQKSEKKMTTKVLKAQKSDEKSPEKSDGKSEEKSEEKERKKMELFEIVEEDDEKDKEGDSAYFNDLIKENPTFVGKLVMGEEEKEVTMVLTTIEMLILEKNESEVFMLDEVMYEDIKKVITKRSAPENITIKTEDKEFVFRVENNPQQFTKELAQKVKK